ncbi:MAG: hypothetical protein ACM3ZU_10010 [Bacteroidota bacterium]
MIIQQTVETLRGMRLDGMADAFLAQMENPATSELSIEERFGLLVDCEMTNRRWHIESPFHASHPRHAGKRGGERRARSMLPEEPRAESKSISSR